MGNTEERLRELTKVQLGLDENEIKLESRFEDDLGADSLDTIELVMAVEEEFDLEISDEAAEQIKTLAQAVELVDRMRLNK